MKVWVRHRTGGRNNRNIDTATSTRNNSLPTVNDNMFSGSYFDAEPQRTPVSLMWTLGSMGGGGGTVSVGTPSGRHSVSGGGGRSRRDRPSSTSGSGSDQQLSEDYSSSLARSNTYGGGARPRSSQNTTNSGSNNRNQTLNRPIGTFTSLLVRSRSLSRSPNRSDSGNTSQQLASQSSSVTSQSARPEHLTIPAITSSSSSPTSSMSTALDTSAQAGRHHTQNESGTESNSHNRNAAIRSHPTARATLSAPGRASPRHSPVSPQIIMGTTGLTSPARDQPRATTPNMAFSSSSTACSIEPPAVPELRRSSHPGVLTLYFDGSSSNPASNTLSPSPSPSYLSPTPSSPRNDTMASPSRIPQQHGSRSAPTMDRLGGSRPGQPEAFTFGKETFC